MVRYALRCSVLVLATAVFAFTGRAQTANKPVTPDDVMSMFQVGLSDQIIIAKIRTHNQPTDLSTEQLVSLKRARVSDAVISALIDPTAPVVAATIVAGNSLAPAGAPSGATTGLSGDPNDPISPHELGIYIFTKDHDGKPKMIELERTAYQGAKTGGLFASAMTYGIAKAKSKAIIPGKSASIRVGEPQPIFYFYFENKAAGLGGNSYFLSQNISNPNQFALIHLDVDKNSRQAEIGEFSMWGASSGNNRKDMVLFKSERLSSGLYKVTIDGAALKRGEYCFMTAPVATSSYAGMAGTTSASNLFDFGVDN